MFCREYMTVDPPMLHADDTVATATRELVDRRQLVLAVVDDSGGYLGLFGVFDLMALLLPSGAVEGLVPDLGFMADDPAELRERLGEKGDLAIGAVLDSDLPVLHPDTPIVEALFLIQKHRTPLAVVEEPSGRLLGLLTHWDALACVRGQER